MWADVAVLIFLTFLLSLFIPAICHPWNNPPPIPSFPQHRGAAVDLIKSLSLPNPLIVEVGAGWGGLTTRLAGLGRVVAIEKSHMLCLWLGCLFRFRGGVEVKCWDAQDPRAAEIYREAQLAVMYLSPGLNAAVVSFLSPGAYVVSICFRCPDLELLEERETSAGKVYLYRKEGEVSAAP
jgi:hypothetical protein